MTCKSLLSFFIFALGGIACASAPSADANAGGEDADGWESSSDEELQPAAGAISQAEAAGCVGAGGDLLPCSMNAECCDGYLCGFDPSRSRVQRYCMTDQ